MKKYIALLLALCLLSSGCGKRQEPTVEAPTVTEVPTTEAATQPEPTAPEATLPETTPATVMGDNIPVVRLLLPQGTAVDVTGYTGDWAKVTLDDMEGLIEARFLRFPDEPFTSWTGYTQWNAGLYPDYTCLGTPLKTFGTNTRAEVLEELGSCLYVRIDGDTGFLPASQLSRYPYQASAGDSGTSGDSGGSSGPQDGGDISLKHPFTVRLLSDAVKTGSASSKIDGVPFVLRLCSLGDTVRVCPPEAAPELPGYTAILESDGSFAYIPTQWLDTYQSFTPWDGYAGSACKLFDSYILSGTEVLTAYTNKPLTVLWDTGTVAFIQSENSRYYTASSTLRETPLPLSPAPDTGSGTGDGSSGSSDLWTPPKM